MKFVDDDDDDDDEHCASARRFWSLFKSRYLPPKLFNDVLCCNAEQTADCSM